MDSRICSAIRNRQVLTFSYDGYHRVVEPHAHGLSKTDNEMVRAYQTAGDSSSGELGWKQFLVRISGICERQVTSSQERDRNTAAETGG